MFWRFGFANASNIDSLLDKEDVSLEAILDEDELLQECKAQNTRLIDYFQRVDVLQRLLGYVTGQIEGEDRGRFKYPYVATEVLCSDIWSIVETCLSHQDQLLRPFWETVLDRPPEDMKTEMVMASQFAKINAVFLNKKPAEMLAFIQAQPNIVERLLRHIETPAFADILVRMIQLDELPSCANVLEWLSKEGLMSRLLDLLSPEHSPNMHSVVAELVKGIISMAAPSPGAGLSDELTNGPASNRFARELAHKHSVIKLVGYILAEPPASSDQSEEIRADTVLKPEVLPNAESTMSSVINSICIIIELIRQNNSDYFEPYLFHTLRNRLIQVQQQLQMHTQDGREALERAMTDMVNRMGVVHLGPILAIMCDNLDALQKYLRQPRSLNGPVLTTVGALTPLTFERYRICELYAELLHCSNMSLLNRPPEYDHLYDSEGRLQGGLSALEELAQVIAIGAGNDHDDDNIDDDDEENDGMEPAHEFPVSAAHEHDIESDDDMSGDETSSSEDDAMEDIAMYEEPRSVNGGSSSLPEISLERCSLVVPSPTSSPAVPSPATSSPAIPSPSISSPAAISPAIISPTKLSPTITSTQLTMVPSRQNSGSDSDGPAARPSNSRRNTRRSLTTDPTDTPPGALVLGERLKKRFLETNVASTLLDLFFEFPWNNFLHSVVYDFIHQILTGRIDLGFNRELTVSLFRDARLMHRIIEGCKLNDEASAKPKGVRLGYMGHLTLISEDVIGALEHFPPDLRLQINQYAPQPEWDEYVTTQYRETKRKDTSLLGGGKPVIAPGVRGGTSQWKVDEADSDAPKTGASEEDNDNGEDKADDEEMEGMTGEFKRNVRTTREVSADFGAAPMDEEEYRTGPPHFASYLAHEIQSGENNSSDEASSDDEDDSGWLAHSTFDLRPPAVSPRQHEGERRPLSTNGFDDVFKPGSPSTASAPPYTDPFDDDAFGPFSDAAAASGSDPFTFPSSMTEETTEDNFEGFGDFGDFQSAASGSVGDSSDLTPTADSWSFASISSTGSEEGGSIGRLSESPQDNDLRTA